MHWQCWCLFNRGCQFLGVLRVKSDFHSHHSFLLWMLSEPPRNRISSPCFMPKMRNLPAANAMLAIVIVASWPLASSWSLACSPRRIFYAPKLTLPITTWTGFEQSRGERHPMPLFTLQIFARRIQYTTYHRHRYILHNRQCKQRHGMTISPGVWKSCADYGCYPVMSLPEPPSGTGISVNQGWLWSTGVGLGIGKDAAAWISTIVLETERLYLYRW